MNKLSFKKLLLLMSFLSFLTIVANAQVNQNNPGRQMFRASSENKESKAKNPKKVSRNKKKQEANDRKLQKDYDKSVVRSRKRTYEIQSPEVQDRMKQNKKDYTKRDKMKKKKVKSGSKGAASKYN
jgi:hypothetical protein